MNAVVLFGAFVAIFITSLSFKMDKTDQRGTFVRPLVIKAPVSSPAMAALEDLREELFIVAAPTFEDTHLESVTLNVPVEDSFYELLNSLTPPDAEVLSELSPVHLLSGLSISTAPSKEREISSPPALIQLEVASRQRLETPSQWSKGLLLRGALEVRGGLAVTGSETYLTVRWMVDGRAQSVGRVNFFEASFEIEVEELKGHLVAELWDSTNRVLGRGSLALETIRLAGQEKQKLLLSIEPHQVAGRIKPLSGYSYWGNEILLPDPQVQLLGIGHLKANEDGVWEQPHLGSGSIFISRVSHENHWPSLSVGVVGREESVEVQARSWVQALQEYAGVDPEWKRALVKGVVTYQGLPVEGAVVEMASGDRPIYFDHYIANPRRESTDQSGQFSFANVRPGLQSVRVRWRDQLYPAVMFPARSEHVSYVNVRLNLPQKQRLVIYDPFRPGEIVSGQMRFYGLEQELSFTGAFETEGTGLDNHQMIEIDAGLGYELSRVMVSPLHRDFKVPQIRSSWLNSILASRRINLSARRGHIVSFVPNGGYKVSMECDSGETGESPVFFDRSGQPVQDSSAAEGGGFIIPGAPSELCSVVLTYADGLVLSQPLISERDMISLLVLPDDGS